MDYAIKVIRNGNVVGKFAGSNMNYDNVVWYVLNDFIKVCKESDDDKLIRNVNRKVSYLYDIKKFRIKDDADVKYAILDLDKGLITLPFIWLELLETLDLNGYPAEIINENGKFVAIFEEDIKEEALYVEFDEELLNKNIVTFEEYYKVFDFMDKLIDKYQSIVIINNKYFVWISYA